MQLGDVIVSNAERDITCAAVQTIPCIFPTTDRPVFPPILDDGEIDVWSTSLMSDQFQLQRLARVLSNIEIAKADRYPSQRERLYYNSARGMLREILGLYLNVAPEDIEFN